MCGLLKTLVLVLALTAAVAGALVLAPAARAHAPFSVGDNESLATAAHISDPTKSWALYADLHEGGEAQYYRFDAQPGDRIPLQLFSSPTREDEGFAPSLVLMGPGIDEAETVPAFVERPAGTGATVVAGAAGGEVTYEPFSPSAMREVASTTLDVREGGTYYVAVFGNDRGGHYGLAVGSRESFTAAEWMTTPLFFATVYAWQGRPLWLVYVPAAIVVALGIALLVLRARRRLDATGWASSIAGLLYVASGVTVVSQMVAAISESGPEAALAVTVVLAVLPIALGWLLIWLALRHSRRWTAGSRVLVAVLGAAGIVVWAGWIVGPLLAVVAAALPAGRAPAREVEAEPLRSTG